MKYSIKIYANALVDLILDKKADSSKIEKSFLELLQKNDDIKRGDRIILQAQILLLKKTGNKMVVIESAREIDSTSFVKSFIKKGDIVKQKINPELIAGIKVMVDGQKQFNNSLSEKLGLIGK